MTGSEHFVTLFDSTFMPQGLVLFQSLLRNHPDPILWVIAMDDQAAEHLERLGHERIRVVRVDDIEDEDLSRLRTERSVAEYCWTITPLAPSVVFDRDDSVTRVTYLDADLYFLGDPSSLLEEFEESGKAVLITEHAYDPEYDWSGLYGRYCVQFMTFVRDNSEVVRSWWQERCKEWCYARTEDGKFGDQMYLDDWTERFGEFVHVLGNRDALLAPWNASRFPLGHAIAWHFHGLRLLGRGRVLLFRKYELSEAVMAEVYKPYLEEIWDQVSKLGQDVMQTQMSTMGYVVRRVLNRLATLSPLARLRSRLGTVDPW